MYAVPVSIYLVYISLVFCICSLIQIMGKQHLKLSRQKRSSCIKKRRSHATASQTLHSCLASIPQGTPSTNLHTYLARTPNTTPPKRLLTYFPSKHTHPASLLRKSRIKAPEQATPHTCTSRECRKTLLTPEKSCDNEMQHNDDDGLQNLTNKLKDTQAFLNKNQLGDFPDKLCTVITTGILSLDNICFRLFIDLINFFSTQDARSFLYQEQTLTWCYVLLKQHGEQILRTCGGLKFLGSQIDSDDHALNPSSAQVNFIVPTASALRKLKPTKLDVSQPRKPGVFHDVLDNMNTDPTVCYNLQFDGKLLKQGVTQHGGDIDCLGKEDPPTLQEQQYMHHVHMEQLDHTSHILDQAYMQYTLTGSIPSPMVSPLREVLLKFHALMSGTIKDLRHFGQQKLRAIEKFKRQGGEEWYKSRFHFVIDSCYTTIHIVDAILHNSVRSGIK